MLAHRPKELLKNILFRLTGGVGDQALCRQQAGCLVGRYRAHCIQKRTISKKHRTFFGCVDKVLFHRERTQRDHRPIQFLLPLRCRRRGLFRAQHGAFQGEYLDCGVGQGQENFLFTGSPDIEELDDTISEGQIGPFHPTQQLLFRSEVSDSGGFERRIERLAGDPFTDQQAGDQYPVDLVGPLIDSLHPLIAVQLLDGVLGDVAVAAVNLQHLIDAPGGRLGTEDLDQGAFRRILLDTLLVFDVKFSDPLGDGRQPVVDQSRQSVDTTASEAKVMAVTSASFSRMAPKLEIGTLNCRRSLA